jgi:hypothetical protein
MQDSLTFSEIIIAIPLMIGSGVIVVGRRAA